MFLLEVIGVWLKVFYLILEAVYRTIVPRDRKDISKEIVLITGAGHGIGREFALEISRLGARVVLWDINKDNVERVANEVRELGGKADAYVCDVSNYDAVKDAAKVIHRDIGMITILINNAGILFGGALMDMKEKHIRRTFDVNTLSQFWTVKEFLPAMMEANHGHILNVASMSAKNGTAFLVDYSASKYAVYGFTEALREELDVMGKTGVKTTTLCPFFVSSGLVDTMKMRFGKPVTPRQTALEGIDGMLREESVVMVPRNLWVRMKFHGLLPEKATALLKRFGDIGIAPQYNPNVDK